MDPLSSAIDDTADFAIGLAFRFAVFVDGARKRLKGRVRRLRGSIAALWRRWLLSRGKLIEGFRRHRGAVPYNRTPAHLEEKVVRLHVEQPHLGAGQLRLLAERVLAFRAARETFRQILIRRRDLVVAFEQQKRKRPRQIVVSRPRELWGVELTLVWLLGFLPVWLLGIVDYHGSRIVALERCRPTAAAVRAIMVRVFAQHGKPERLLTDNGPAFIALDFELFLAEARVDHTRIRPGHPWTNGRIERVFRTFKETVFRHLWLFASARQIARYCADFVQFYNRDRPHTAYDGRTPNEVFFGLKKKGRIRGRVSYFDGALSWYRFG